MSSGCSSQPRTKRSRSEQNRKRGFWQVLCGLGTCMVGGMCLPVGKIEMYSLVPCDAFQLHVGGGEVLEHEEWGGVCVPTVLQGPGAG